MENLHIVGKNLSKSAIKTILFELARSPIRVDPFLHKVEFQNYDAFCFLFYCFRRGGWVWGSIWETKWKGTSSRSAQADSVVAPLYSGAWSLVLNGGQWYHKQF